MKNLVYRDKHRFGNVGLWFSSVIVHSVLTFYYMFKMVPCDTAKRKLTSHAIKLFCHWPICINLRVVALFLF